MEDFEIPVDECLCVYCYYEGLDSTDCPCCDLELFEFDKKVDSPTYNLFEYVEDSNCYYLIGSYTVDELPKIKFGENEYSYFDECYEPMLALFNRKLVSV